MDLTRRAFLAVTGASPLALAPGIHSGRDGCVVVSGTAECLAESALGFVQCAGKGSAPIELMCRATNHARAATFVVPAGLLDQSLARRLREAAWSGASVLIELGLAFVDEPLERAQRFLISEEFDLTLGDVVRLWDDGRSRVPYVRYLWPIDVWVRDFSSVVAVSGAGWRVIAQIETRACRRAPTGGARVAHDPRVTVGAGIASRGSGSGGVVSPLPAW